MTTPSKPAEEIIPLFNVEMKSLVPDFMGKHPWVMVGGPYERDEADEKIAWLEDKHPQYEYRIVKADV